MKTVLVTGSQGFIGKALVHSLAQKSFRVIQTGRRSNALAEPSNSSEYYQIDFEDAKAYEKMLCLPHSDAIIHLGTAVGWSGATLDDMFVPNILATGCIARLARVWDAHLCFASAAIIAGIKTSFVCSSSPVLLDTPYAKTKYLGEELIKASGANYCILRIGGVFGLNGPSHLGINNSLNSALVGEPPLLRGNGGGLRNYIYVKDLVDIIVNVLENQFVGTHLVGGSDEITIADMLMQICEIFLPGMQPKLLDGNNSSSQLIECSKDLPNGLGFREALLDIKSDAVQLIK